MDSRKQLLVQQAQRTPPCKADAGGKEGTYNRRAQFHASAWLYGNAEADPRLWLSPAELAVAIRLRLGLPIAPMPSICRLCGTGSADVDGVHARSCFSGGRRTRMHNALRDVIADFARRGLLAPAVERPVFSNTERSARTSA
ncbi:hypothetical protein DIPPA_33314, partial [Diplonema papillatum]